MSGWLNQLQSMLGQKTSGSGEQGLSKLLVPGALGGLAGLLVANKSSRKLLAKYGTGALLAGGGAIAGTVLWNKYKDRVRAAHRDEPHYGEHTSPLDLRTERLILALVFAAKSDGHIDDNERAAIEQQLREAGVEEQGRTLVAQAIEQPLDPQRLALSVKNEEEALELYFLSCAAIDIDHFMERGYLNALGDALKIPQDVREGIEKDIGEQKQALQG
ncbi:tellurite resistance TerB family protein [Enterobacter cloacae complex sp. P3B]|uniref:tellurite resistance TerB family protein n=1 Tax=Enterobacter TaxID=547 RepID=UPI001868ED6E|nr:MULTISPECIES: tellurite resistance TerB family protein [Enterobacter]ELK6538995.1 tellurite resistance TerB family protein [Enterobacter bugandensis]MBE3179500.1 tellurite resistance TerB family protein [Enterobacter cloacae complex sp. P26RS]MBE3434457.1 tellurite resistance TerB family protein [Enterobacter cloacae complex sp. P21RS]MBE3461944.1 tellurite resistance TerB family protein [Enterobacter cloacae complex sp. P21C]MBE3500417.1 tellurite resistance TerB family protein [Enterobact